MSGSVQRSLGSFVGEPSIGAADPVSITIEAHDGTDRTVIVKCPACGQAVNPNRDDVQGASGPTIHLPDHLDQHHLPEDFGLEPLGGRSDGGRR